MVTQTNSKSAALLLSKEQNLSLELGWDRENPHIFTIEDVAKIDPIRS